jgi:hypothetical protein
VCVVSIPDFETATLESLLALLHEKLNIDTSNIFIDFENKIIFERYPDDDDDD